MRMPSKYILVAVVVVCVAAWFQLSSNPITLNTFRLFKSSLKASRNPVSFYKLSLQWPRATCSYAQMRCPNPLPIPYNNMFTIHGIWPQDIYDEEIERYSLNRNCTGGVIPTARQALPTYLGPIYPLLNVQWPNLNNPNNSAANYQFWGNEWEKHGQCSDYPTNPYNYFNSALQLKHTFTPDLGFQSGQSYTVQQVVNKVYNSVRYLPEISCNRDRNNISRIQLVEIRFCYYRPQPPQQFIQNIRNCPNPTGKIGTLCYNYNTSLVVP